MSKTHSKAIKAIESSRSSLKKALKGKANLDLSWISNPSSNTDWPMASDSLTFIVSLIANLRPKHILEFGTGISTYVMAKACSMLNLKCKITSIDHDPEFGEAVARRYLDTIKTTNEINFLFSPLVARCFGEKHLPSYYIKQEQADSLSVADLVLIDGPPSYLGGREGILYQTMDYAAPGTIVLLDDANRNEEKNIIHNWRDTLGNKVEINLLTELKKGLAAIIIHEPIKKDDLYSHKINLTERDLLALISKNEQFILIDDEMSVRKNIASMLKVLYFTERNGKYWKPSDAEEAIQEFERLRGLGAKYIVFVWPSFWWFKHYNVFYAYLKSNFQCITENSRLVIFAL